MKIRAARAPTIQSRDREGAMTNKRRKTGGYYLDREEIRDAIDAGYPMALKRAALEAFEGTLDEEELAGRVDEDKIKQEALSLVMEARDC